MVESVRTDPKRSLSSRWHTRNCGGMSTWKAGRMKAEPSNVARRVCARKKQIQKQLLFKLTKKRASFMSKHHFIIAATMGGTFHIKIRFAERERSWAPSDRPQSVVLVGVESCAQRWGQIPSRRAVPTPVRREPRPDSAHLWLTSLGAERAKPLRGRELRKRSVCLVQNWFLLALDTPKWTGREKGGNLIRSALELL